MGREGKSLIAWGFPFPGKIRSRGGDVTIFASYAPGA